MAHNKLTLFDYILYLILIGLGFFFIFFNHFNKIGSMADIYISGKIVKTINLRVDKDYAFQGKMGRFKVQVKNGKIGVVETSCKEKICKRMGFIQKAGSEIICVPNRIVIKIRGEGKIDAISQ